MLIVTSNSLTVSEWINGRVPALLQSAGPRASETVVEFFLIQLRSENTRKAYLRNISQFCRWMKDHGVTEFHELAPAMVAAWIRQMEQSGAKPGSVQQRLSALRSLFSYMVSEGVILRNPAASIKARISKANRGKTPVIDGTEAGRLLRSIDTTTLVGLRDRALIGLMLYTCARVSAAVGVTLGDRFEEDHVLYLILHEKGCKEHRVPCNHMLEKYLREYMQRAPFPNDPKFPFFPAFMGKSEVMSSQPLNRIGAWKMVKRRGLAAYILDSAITWISETTGAPEPVAWKVPNSTVVAGFERSHCEPSDKIVTAWWESSSPGLWIAGHNRDQRKGLILFPHVTVYPASSLLLMVSVPAQPMMTLVLKAIRLAPHRNFEISSQIIHIIRRKDPDR